MTLKKILQPLKPIQIIGAITSYLLGAGLIQYIEPAVDPEKIVQGGIFLLSFIIGLNYLCGLQGTLQLNLWKDTSKTDLVRIRWAYRITAAFFVTFSTSLFIGWMVQGGLWPGLTILVTSMLVLAIFYFLAHVHDKLHPYQVLFEVIIVIISPPVLVFFLQSESIHRFLTMSMTILVPLYLAYRLLADLIGFDTAGKRNRSTLGLRLGWDTVMVLHNALILTAYTLLALMTLLGFPWFLVWPVFLGLPIGLVEIWLMERVRKGFKPLWQVMRIATLSIFIITGYFLAFAFWSR